MNANDEKKTKYTPGPWVYDGYAIVSACGVRVLYNEYEHAKDGRPDLTFTNGHDATIVEAAPDLFAALEALEKAASAFAYKADCDDDWPVRDACDAARAALRKARGEVQP